MQRELQRGKTTFLVVRNGVNTTKVVRKEDSVIDYGNEVNDREDLITLCSFDQRLQGNGAIGGSVTYQGTEYPDWYNYRVIDDLEILEVEAYEHKVSDIEDLPMDDAEPVEDTPL